MNGAVPVVDARGIGRSYGRAEPACAEVDLVVAAGEIVGICGPSGSGKSTLLRLLGGAERPSTGDLDLAGHPVVRAGRRVGRPARPGFAMPVFQDPVGSLDARWPIWRTITEPATAPHRAERPGRATRRSLAREALGRVGLAGLDIDARPSELSVGQCQRVAILRATLAAPSLVLADEPTSALDVTAAAGVLAVLRDVAAHGAALVVVSHDEVLLDVLADRVLRMNHGRFTPLGEAVYQRRPTVDG